MNEYYNKMILKDEVYNSGLFPQVPKYNKQGSVYILAEGINDNILVDEKTTTKEVKKGKYKRLVEISTFPYMEEIRFESASQEASFTFDVYVKAVIQVKNPLIFYYNRNLDVTSYFRNMFSLDVRKITRKYSILSYDGMDEELKGKLSSYNNEDVSTGFEYQISAVDAEPGEKAIEYVRQSNEQTLKAKLKENARMLAKEVSFDYATAVRTEVIEGRLTEEEAIIKVQKFKQANYEERIKQISELRGMSFITDADARSMVKKTMMSEESRKLMGQEQGNKADISSGFEEDTIIDGFYEED